MNLWSGFVYDLFMNVSFFLFTLYDRVIAFEPGICCVKSTVTLVAYQAAYYQPTECSSMDVAGLTPNCV